MITAPATSHWDPMSAGCPSRALLDRIGDKWTVLILIALEGDRRRFSELRRMVDGISEKMLSQTLRALTEDGLVTRTVYPVVPPRVDYALTDLGSSLMGPLHGLFDWAVNNMDQVQANRQATSNEAVTASER